MANFRCERLFVMLDEPVPGFDHLHAVDPEAFAALFSEDDAESIDIIPIERYAYGPSDRPRWHRAADGLHTVRSLIELYEKWLSRGPGEAGRYTAEALNENLAVLRKVEAVLDAADSRDRRFYFKMKDLA
jgi:hypothetical protein